MLTQDVKQLIDALIQEVEVIVMVVCGIRHRLILIVLNHIHVMLRRLKAVKVKVIFLPTTVQQLYSVFKENKYLQRHQIN